VACCTPVTHPVLLLLYDSSERAAAGIPYQREAARLGFRVVSADSRLVQPAPRGLVVVEGHEAGAGGERRPLIEEHLTPDVLLHRKLIWGQSEELVSTSWEADRPLCSYHPAWKPIGDKWALEECFEKAERQGPRVPRPRSFRLEAGKASAELAGYGRSRPLIFKPAAGSLCEGIVLSSPESFDAVVEATAGSRARYVVQELVDGGLRFRGRRFDLRIYALVTSFAPLRALLPREGVVRLAAREPHPAAPLDPAAVLTGRAYRRRHGLPVENASISELLGALAGEGRDVAGFWDQVEGLVGTVLTAIAGSGLLPPPAELGDRFYLAGMDLLVVSSGGRCRPLFLETNYVPDLVGWGEGVDGQLGAAHRQWLEELRRLAASRAEAVQARNRPQTRLRQAGPCRFPRFT
jgi:hypothetical protein